jgi:hypothetical protein
MPRAARSFHQEKVMGIYHYSFAPSVQFEEVEASLVLAVLAVESLHGESQVRLDAGHALDADKRQIVIDATTQVGRDLNRMFIGFVSREFGADVFEVERADAPAVAVAA